VSERRLIEEYLPVGAVSYEATREKLLRRRDYHISMLHLWWARRPLAAARAAVYAALVPAPDDLDAEATSQFFSALCAWGGPESAIARARKEVLAANGGVPPKVLDMFAGGGAIPLEASRLGCETTAVELNPVAHLIELCTLEYPQRFGPSLAEDVRRWGARLIESARDEIGWMYPELVDEADVQTSFDGISAPRKRIPISYLWTRTVACPNPAERPHTVPLVRQTWLVKRSGRYVGLKVAPQRDAMRLSYEVVQSNTREGLGFDPEAHSSRGSTTCPLCGASIDLKYVKLEANAGRLGAELMGMALLPAAGRGKTYIGSDLARELLPDMDEIAATLLSLDQAGFPRPAGSVPRSSSERGSCTVYGLTEFAQLFTDRQTAMLLSLCRIARTLHDEMAQAGVARERADAILTYLGMLIDRIADRSSTLSRWDNSRETTANTFARQTLPMTWDYAEINPFGGSSGDLAMHLRGVAMVIEHCAQAGAPSRVVRGSATELPFPDGEFGAVLTDPPYYDNISYADVSDFFYGWLQRSIGHIHPEHLSRPATPKRSEIVSDSNRHGGDRRAARASYESMMLQAFCEARRVLKSDGVLVCVYAHQTTAGWSTLIEAVRRAGFVVVEAWPLDTEMPVRGVAQGTASLASSIFLVGRPRLEATTGDWASEVRPELSAIVGERVDTLPQLGITGTDLVIAAVGAGMRAYTRFTRVEKPNGEELSPDEYLDEVEREVAEAVLARIFKTDRRGVGRVDQLTQFYVMGRFEFGDAIVPWDELNTLARGTGVELGPLARGSDALVSFGDKRDRARFRDFSERGSAVELGLDGSRSTIDHLQRILWLSENESSRLAEYLAQARPDAERLRLVAHALARPGLDTAGGRGAEADACERLLAVWHRVIEDNLFSGSSG
jgi:putative DNA methylase